MLNQLNKSIGGLAKMSTVPLRHHEDFAQVALGVNPSLCRPEMAAFKNPQKLFFARASILHPGKVINWS